MNAKTGSAAVAAALAVLLYPPLTRADRDIVVDGTREQAWDGTAQWNDAVHDTGAPDIVSVNFTNNNTSGTDGYLFGMVQLSGTPSSGLVGIRFDFGGTVQYLSWNTSSGEVRLGGWPIYLYFFNSRVTQTAMNSAHTLLEFAIPYSTLSRVTGGRFAFGHDAFDFYSYSVAYADGWEIDRSPNPDSNPSEFTYDGTKDPSVAAVSLVGAFVERTEDGNLLTWRTRFESANVAFRVERQRGGSWELVAVVPGHLDDVGVNDYALLDAGGGPDERYRLIDVEATGLETAHELSPSLGRSHSPRALRLLASPRRSPKKPHEKPTQGGALVDVNTQGLVKLGGAALAKFGLSAHHTAVLAESGPVPVLVDGKDLYFWSPAPPRGYDGRATYLLASAPAPRMKVERSMPLMRPAADTVPVTAHFEVDRFRWSGASTEASFLWASGVNGINVISVPLVAEGVHPRRPARLRVALEGGTTYPVSPDHVAAVALNGTELGEVSFDGWSGATFDFDLPVGLLADGPNVLTITPREVPGARYNAVYLDWAEADYQRIVSGPPGFVTKLDRAVALAPQSPDALVLDVTTPLEPRVLAPSRRGQIFPDSRASVAVTAFARALEPELRPAGDPLPRHKGADYVVIHPPGFEEAARRLADARRSRGMKTLLLATDAVERTYANGARGPEALRRLMRDMRSWRRVPRAVVLLGGASYDPRDIAGTGKLDLVPTGSLRTAHGVWADSDLALACAPGEPLPPFDLGRIPADDPGEALAAVEKILASDRQRPARTTTTVVEGSGTGSAEFVAMGNALGAATGSTIVDTAGTDPHGVLAAALDSGTDALFFIGHGQPAGWSARDVWDVDDALAARNEHLPVVFSLSCYDGMFANPSTPSLAGAMLLSPGGARAVFSPSSVASPTQHRAVLDALLAAGPQPTVGGLVRAVRERLAQQGESLEEVGYFYNLLGDPLSPAP